MIKPFKKDQAHSMKWFYHQQQPNTIDLTLAEMDFGLYQPFQKLLKQQLKNTTTNLKQINYRQSVRTSRIKIIQWYQKYHKVQNIPQQSILFYSSVATLCSCSILAYTQPQDNILIFAPVYPFYQNTIKSLNRKVITLNMQYCAKKRQFIIDYQQLREKSKLCKMLILSHPHNPSGRVWSHYELSQIVKYCQINNSVIFSDEILSDLALIQRNRQFQTLLRFNYDKIIMANSLSKSFNASSLQTGYTIIKNNIIRQKIQKQLLKYYGSCSEPNIIANIYYKICLSKIGYSWLQKINVIFCKNYQKLLQYRQRYLEKLIVGDLDSGYLVYMDFREYGQSSKQLKQLFKNRNIYVTFMNAYYQPPKQTVQIRMAISVEHQIFVKFLNQLKDLLMIPKSSL